MAGLPARNGKALNVLASGNVHQTQLSLSRDSFGMVFTVSRFVIFFIQHRKLRGRFIRRLCYFDIFFVDSCREKYCRMEVCLNRILDVTYLS